MADRLASRRVTLQIARPSTRAWNTKGAWSWWSCAPSLRTTCRGRRRRQCRDRQVLRTTFALGRRRLLAVLARTWLVFLLVLALARPARRVRAVPCAPVTRRCRCQK